jgi:hypothetical protein
VRRLPCSPRHVAKHYGELVLVAVADATVRRGICDELARNGYRPVAVAAITEAVVARLRPVGIVTA